MTDRISYGVAETGTWQTGSPTPHIDLDGGVPAGLSIRQSFAEALTSGNFITVTVRKDVANWACYGYKSGDTGTSGPEFTSGSPDTLDFSAANLLDSNGTIANGDSIEVWVELPESEPVSGGWVDGATVTDWIDTLNELGTLSGNVSPALSAGHTLSATLDASRTINFTATIAAGEAVHWDMILDSGGFTPTFQFNAVAIGLPAIYDVSTDATYLFSFVATTAGAWLAAVEMA